MFPIHRTGALFLVGSFFSLTGIALPVCAAQSASQETTKEASETPATCAIPNSTQTSTEQSPPQAGAPASALSQPEKSLNPALPIVGLLMYDKVLITELTAPMDVFTKHSKEGEALFNVITIAEANEVIVSEEGLKVVPDFTIENAPKLDILIVPSAYDMSSQVENKALVDFIKRQDDHTEYTVSNCAGAQLIGEAGIADGKEIVTWIGGGKDLQKNYPKMKVQDDAQVSYVEDGKFLSSNGNLASYISSLELLEKLTSKEHRKFVESYLYLDRLQNWKE